MYTYMHVLPFSFFIILGGVFLSALFFLLYRYFVPRWVFFFWLFLKKTHDNVRLQLELDFRMYEEFIWNRMMRNTMWNSLMFVVKAKSHLYLIEIIIEGKKWAPFPWVMIIIWWGNVYYIHHEYGNHAHMISEHLRDLSHDHAIWKCSLDSS